MKQLPTLLITGATGFTGQHACTYFARAGYDVTAVSRNPILHNQIKAVQCNLTDKESVENLVKNTKPQFLLHLAGQNHVGQSWSDPVSTLEANFISTLYLIDAIRKESSACKTVIVGSALQFDPSNISNLIHPYSFSKTLQVLVAQAWAKLYKLHVVIAKPSNIIGPGNSNGICSILAKKIVGMEKNNTEKILEVTNLRAQRDFIDVRDVVSAYEILLKEGMSGEIYEISSGKSHSIEEVINRLKGLSTIKFQTKSLVNVVNEEIFKIIPFKLLSLGWKPTITLQSSLEDILSYYRDNY